MNELHAVNFIIFAQTGSQENIILMDGDSPFNLTGYTLQLHAKEFSGPLYPYIFNMAIGSGIVVNDAVNGNINVNFPPVVTSKTLNLSYDLIGTGPSGQKVTFIHGRIALVYGNTNA